MPTDQDRREDDEPGLLDEVADRLGFRARLKRNPALALAYRIAIALVGTAIAVLGLALVPLPGPGWLIVFAGLALLATEFVWAERLLHFARRKVQGWTEWVLRQSLLVRALIGLLGVAFLAGLLAIYAEVVGLPAWLPLIG